MRLASGREVQATANHPFLTFGGWQTLGISVWVAGRHARTTPVPLPSNQCQSMKSSCSRTCSAMDRSSSISRFGTRASTRRTWLRSHVAAMHFGITAVRDDYPAARCTSLRLPAPHHLTHRRRNPIAEWLDSFGLFGLRSHEKFFPDRIFSLPKEQLALFIRHLWATDGSITVSKSVKSGSTTLPQASVWPGNC